MTDESLPRPNAGKTVAPPASNTAAAASSAATTLSSLDTETLKQIAVDIISGIEAVPRDIRGTLPGYEPLEARVEELKAAPDRVLGDEGFIRKLFTLAEAVLQYAIVLSALTESSQLFSGAIEKIPGVHADGDAEVESIPAPAEVGARTRVLRHGYRSPEGKELIKPRITVSSRQLTEHRAYFETFPVLADAFETLAPAIEKSAYFWLRKAPELIDQKVGGDPTSPQAMRVLSDCVRFANDLGYLHCIPEYATLLSGVNTIVDHLAVLLREHGYRIFPSATQPYREGRPAPLPFANTVLKEIPDPSPAGTLLRVRERGWLREGKVESEAIIIVSAGDKKPVLAKAFRTIACEVRRRDESNYKVWKGLIEKVDQLILEWLEVGSDKDRGLALRYLVNLLDESAERGPLAESAEKLVEYLRDTHKMRPLAARVGQRLDDSVDIKEWDFERRPGSGMPPQTILQVKRRAFKDANGLVVQKGLLAVS